MPKNLFATALPSTARSSEYGYPTEHFDTPSGVLEDEVAYPEFAGVEGGPSEHRANTGELFQGGNPAYAGEYALGFQNDPGITPGYSEAVPAPGSASLSAPRNSGEVTGTNRVIRSTGPVSGMGQDGFTGQRAVLNKPNPNYGGPVTGGADQAASLQAAYWASQAAAVSLAAANAAMVSAV